MINYDTTTINIEGKAGINLISKILTFVMTQVSDNTEYNLETLQSKNLLKNETIYKTLIGLLSMGYTSFSDVEQFRHNEVFKECLDLKFTPAQETLRLYLEKEITDNFVDYCNLINIELLKKVTYCCEKITNKYIPLDFDVTPMLNPKCKKEECSRTYKGEDGFAPLMSYLGAYCIGAELRPGKQHSQKDSIPFVQKVLNDANEILSPEEYSKVLCRFDSGHDSVETVNVLHNSNVNFIIKKKSRRNDYSQDLLERAKSLCDEKINYSYRNTTVYYGYFTEMYPLGKEDVTDKAQIAFKIKECYEDKKGNSLLFPEIELNLYWTNLAEDAQTIVNLYKDHATSEQYHSEIKTDLNFEKLASGKYRVNKMLLSALTNAYNILRIIGEITLLNQTFLPEGATGDRDRIRMKTILRDIIYTSARYIRKGKDWVLRLYNKNPWTKLLLRIDACINKYFPIFT
jgi:hypothetical protein